MAAPKIPNRSFFEEEVGQSFIDASIKTIESYFGATPTMGSYRFAQNHHVPYEIAGMIHFEANHDKVQMMLLFERPFARELYEKMVGQAAGDDDADLLDCSAELTNILYGYAKANLVDQGHSFSRARPEGVKDPNQHLQGKKSLEIPFQVKGSSAHFSIVISI